MCHVFSISLGLSGHSLLIVIKFKNLISILLNLAKLLNFLKASWTSDCLHEISDCLSLGDLKNGSQRKSCHKEMY